MLIPRRISCIIPEVTVKDPQGGEILRKTVLILLLVSVALMPVISCKEDPVTPEKDDGLEWPSMTDREDVVETLLMAYANPRNAESLAKYNALLHSDYFFGLDARDFNPGESPILTRTQDITATQFIFDNQRLLELVLSDGTWHEIAELEGETCTDCWTTQRVYFIRLQIENEGTIYQSAIERMAVNIVAAPDEGDPGKWVIRAVYDMRL
jgi:hypothetical protein